MNQNMLDAFGKLLMEEVRDYSLERAKNIINGEVKAPELIQLSNKITNMNEHELSIIKELINENTNNVIFNFLNLLEQNEDILKLIYINEKNEEHNIVDLSDGLAGELFTEDGWIEKFSNFKSKDLNG